MEAKRATRGLYWVRLGSLEAQSIIVLKGKYASIHLILVRRSLQIALFYNTWRDAARDTTEELKFKGRRRKLFVIKGSNKREIFKFE